MRYLTRQVAMDAIQWDGKEDTFGQIRDMLGDEYDLEILDEVEGILQVDTATGTAWPLPGDWVTWDGEYANAYKNEQFKMLFIEGKPYYRLPMPTYIKDMKVVDVKLTSSPMYPTTIQEQT